MPIISGPLFKKPWQAPQGSMPKKIDQGGQRHDIYQNNGYVYVQSHHIDSARQALYVTADSVDKFVRFVRELSIPGIMLFNEFNDGPGRILSMIGATPQVSLQGEQLVWPSNRGNNYRLAFISDQDIPLDLHFARLMAKFDHTGQIANDNYMIYALKGAAYNFAQRS